MYTLKFADTEPICRRHVWEIEPKQRTNEWLVVIPMKKGIPMNKFTYLNPRHIMLLHFFHLLLDAIIQFMLEFQRLHVIHISIVVVKIPKEYEVKIFLIFSWNIQKIAYVEFSQHFSDFSAVALFEES